jgi:hypothetical protein
MIASGRTAILGQKRPSASVCFRQAYRGSIQLPLPEAASGYSAVQSGHRPAKELLGQKGLIGSSTERMRKQSSQSRSVPGPAACILTMA